MVVVAAAVGVVVDLLVWTVGLLMMVNTNIRTFFANIRTFFT